MPVEDDPPGRVDVRRGGGPERVEQVLPGDPVGQGLASVRAAAARDLGRPGAEQRAFALAALDAAIAQGDPQVLLDLVEHVGGLLVDRGDHRTALRLLEGARSVREQDGVPRSVPRRARRDADEARAREHAGGSEVVEAPTDLDWLLAAAVAALQE